MKSHGYIGILIVVLAEILLFSGNKLVGEWFTPIVWTGYILFIDAIVYRVTKRSLLVTDRRELLVIAVISIAAWWLGYDWAFATIFPALFETAALFQATLFAGRGPKVSLRLSKPMLYVMIAIGAVAVILPLVVLSTWFAPVVWLSFIFLLDPINRLRGQPS
ncbi:MAG: hypothetical protein ABR557_14555, partial [Pyrinomonadaceae bacterium]